MTTYWVEIREDKTVLCARRACWQAELVLKRRFVERTVRLDAVVRLCDDALYRARHTRRPRFTVVK